MKFKRLFSLLGLGLFAAISAGAGVALNSAKANPVSADGKTVYCKMEYSWWKTGDSSGDASIGAYYWKSANESDNNGWPGTKMEYVELDTDVWKFTIPSGYDKVIFTRLNSAGNLDWGAQTENLNVPTDDNVLYTISSSTAQWTSEGHKVAGSWGTYVEPVPGSKTWMFKAKLNLSSCSPNNPSSVFPAENAVDDVWFHYWGTHVNAWAQAKFSFTDTNLDYDHYSVNISLRDDQTITGAQWKIHQQNLIDGDKYSIDIGTFGGSLVTSLDKDTNIYGLQWDFANSWTGEGKWTFGSSDGYASTSFKTSVSGSESMMVKDPVNNVFYVKDIEATTSNTLGLVIEGNYVFRQGFREMLDAGSKKYASGGNEIWFYFAENGTYDLFVEDACIALRKQGSPVDTYIYYCIEDGTATNDYIYSWGGSQQFGAWPGTKITSVVGVQEVTGSGTVHFEGGENDKLIYKIPVQIGYPVGDVNFKWNNNGSWESEEFALVAGAAYWYTGGAHSDAGAALDFIVAAEAKRNAAASYSVCNISKGDATTLVNAYNALDADVRSNYVDKTTIRTWSSKEKSSESRFTYRAVVLQLGAIAGVPVVGATRINTISETTAESSTMIAIVGIIALVSVSAVSILIVLKKRKIN